MAKKVLMVNLSEPLGSMTAANFDISAGTGNLTIERNDGGEGYLASGALEYLEKQGPPTWKVDEKGGRAVLTLKASGGRQPGFRLPWAACNGETNWHIHLNPGVPSEITAYSGGGNVRLDLAGMAVQRVSAETGGGNIDVVLPESAPDISVAAKSGAGNVTVEIGSGFAARIQAFTGLGKVIVDPCFSQTGKDTYQSPDYEGAANKADLTLKSGAGNVIVKTR
ncbi:MAG: cell wall-active antibiotics response protein [Chloroflexi bacterium]|nr:cell wall-active antibiotics response protein [Chloroflexota bacterium]